MKKQYIYSFLGVVLIIIVGFLVFTNRTTVPLNKEIQPSGTVTPVTGEASLIVGDIKTTINFKEGETLYDALLRAKDSGLIVEFKEYPGMGYLVTAIGPYVSTSTKYLMYLVNGEEASMGISSYILKPGDVIEWQLR